MSRKPKKQLYIDPRVVGLIEDLKNVTFGPKGEMKWISSIHSYRK